MGRGRGKGRKQIVISRDENGCNEDDKLLAKRRGRPLKMFKDETEEVDEIVKRANEAETEEEESKLNGSGKNLITAENGKNRKRTSLVLEDEDDNLKIAKAKPANLMQGFRQIGSRRKNKPRRAAEVGVECR